MWVKSRVSDELEADCAELFGARAATLDRHPILGIDPVNCTPQLGVPGPWSDRLPHFRMGFTPSNGDELQSEFFVSRDDAVAAIATVRELADSIRPLVQVCEIRTIASDGLWMSPQYRRDSVGIHVTWHPDQAAVHRALALLETALAPFGARPHWGKLFVAEASAVAPLYPRHADFARLVDRIDPRQAFRNAWLERHVLGGHRARARGRRGRSSTHRKVTQRRPRIAASRRLPIPEAAPDRGRRAFGRACIPAVQDALVGRGVGDVLGRAARWPGSWVRVASWLDAREDDAGASGWEVHDHA